MSMCLAGRHAVPKLCRGPLRSRRRLLAASLLFAAAGWLGTGGNAQAELLVTPTTLTLDLAPGGIGIVRGDITNTTGFNLQSVDFVGSFSGFPSDALVVEQLLGLSDVAIPDRAITRGLELFSVQLGSAALAGARYDIEFFFGEVVGGNFGSPAVVAVTVPGSQPIPEPAVAWLVGGALIGLAATRRRGQTNTAQEV